MKKIKKSMSLILAVMLVLCAFTAIPFTASAATNGGKITVSSNVCDSATYQYDENSKQVEVTYFLECPNKILNVQATMNYDNTVLKVASTNTLETSLPVFKSGSAVINFKGNSKVLFNASNLNLYNFRTKATVVTVTFDIIGSGDTTVDLNVDVLTGTKAENMSEITSKDRVNYVKHEEMNLGDAKFSASANVIGSQPTTGATLYMAAPVFKEGTSWDDIYLTYASNSNVSAANKIAMEKTDNLYYASGNLAGSLSNNTNWAVYKVELTDEQIAAIDASNYTGFTNKYNNYRTNFIWANSVFRANTDKTGYKSAKTSVKDLDGKMFVITDASSLTNKSSFLGNWVSNNGEKAEGVIYTASPVVNDTTSMGDVYFRYGKSSTIADATQIRMTKLTYTYANTNSSSVLKKGDWTVYSLNLTASQMKDIDACNYTSFTSAYGADVRTNFTYSNSVTRAKVGSYGNYNSAKTNMSDLNGKMFFITNSASANTKSYLGYWNEPSMDIMTATFKVAVPDSVNGTTIKGMNLYYSTGANFSDAKVLSMTKTNETFKPQSIKTSLISSSTSWSVYEITVDAEQYAAINASKKFGFASADGKVKTLYSWSGNVIRAGVGSYQYPYNTSSTPAVESFDGSTFVMNGCDSANKISTMTGYWAA